MQSLQISKSSPWSKCKAIGKSVSNNAASTNLVKYTGFAYLRAPADTCKINGACSTFAASTIPWIISMSFTLNAPIAYPPA